MRTDRHLPSPAVVEYSTQPPASPQKALRWDLGAIAILIAVAVMIPAGYRLYDASVTSSVVRALRVAPNVRSVTTVDCDNGPLPSKVVSATVYLTGTGTRVIELHKPTRGELSSGDHLRLALVGSVALYTDSRGTSVLDYIDVGRDGEFAGMLPIRGVGDLTNHYDELLAFVKSLPATGTYTAKDGGIHEFCKR